MRPLGGAKKLEARRRRAVALLRQGFRPCDVARQVGASPSSVNRWRQAVADGGLKALAARPTPGRPPRLSSGQERGLLKVLARGAQAAGFANDWWTLPRVAAVIEERFGVHYHSAHVWKILRRCGWSCQKPERRMRERDEAAIARWRRRRWPHIKKRRASGV
jgi:transposase